MKANELMIGDKLKTTFSQKIVKVKEIKQNCIYTEDNGYEYNEIEPIPLTPEVLEKNGFVIDDEWYIYTGQGVNIDVAFRDDNKFVYDLSILTGSGSMDIHAKYVHELQHALRLCDITHEIIL